MPEYKEYMYYCPKCGDAQFLEDKDGEQCEICGHKMLETPHEYQLTVKKYFEINLPELERAEKVRRNTEWEKKRQRLHEELISKSEIFDFDLYQKKDDIREERYQTFLENLAQGRAILDGTDKGNPYGVRCPYCNATNVKKISGLSRVGAIAFLGVFGIGKSSKQWHCTHCGSDF